MSHKIYNGNPGGTHVSVTASDSTTYDPPLSFLYVGGAGNVAITDKDGTTVTWVGLAAGSIIPMRCVKVMSTNTTATSIVGVRN